MTIDKDAIKALATDAANARLHDNPPDGIVMRAIELGLGTRRELKEATGFSYDVIERCLERNAGDIRTTTVGQIERFVPVSQLFDATKVEYICVDCGGPRSYGSGQRCKKCYDAKGKASHRLPRVEFDAHDLPHREGAARKDNSVIHESEKSNYEAVPIPLCGCGRANNHGYAGNVHSQNGEDGIIAECLKRMKIEIGYSVEVGGNDGLWLSNTRNLLEKGWSGLFVEADFGLWQQCWDAWKQRPDVRCACSRVDQYNVNAFVDDSCDVLSLDTDGSDYKIFKGLQAAPRIVIVEIDSSIPPDELGFNSDGGAGYREMLDLAYVKNYHLIAHTGNMVFVESRLRHLFPDISADPREDVDLYFNRGWLKAA